MSSERSVVVKMVVTKGAKKVDKKEKLREKKKVGSSVVQ
jgi:tmRNA-binding protein